MILNSNASKNEDRFYSILPLSEYKNILLSENEVDQWNISTMVSVKVKLFEFMGIKDKLNLLFMSGSVCTYNIGTVLPTFATSTLSSAVHSDYVTLDSAKYPYNFDLANKSTIMLHYQPTSSNNNNNKGKYASHLYYLNIKPMEYSMKVDSRDWYSSTTPLKIALLKRLLIDDPNATIDVVYIPAYSVKNTNTYPDTISYHYDAIILLGNFRKNKWILDELGLPDDLPNTHDWAHCFSVADHPGFNIY
ncbi:hypothetical protein BCR42DRAFT_427234 [Absidia repens]|uniref:Uncharacterized protein n=1 Tax=Absidia repens TaxID=90262 RepID=A0A1X2I095_9FUNG|nr:hypothetical protein BCR42DRAFT_427234 [Absidia repens]